MKVLTLALLFSLSVPKLAPPVRQPVGQLAHRARGGRWYFAESGHAIYCYGPVMTVPRADGNLQKVATICQDGSAMIPLKD